MKKHVTTLVAAALLAGCSPSIETASQDFNTLPPGVQKTVRAQAPEAEITSVTKTSDNGRDAYRVELRQNGQDAQLLVSADGRVLSSDLAKKSPGAIQKMLTPTGAVGTKFSSLPEAVQKAIQAHAPPIDIADISRHEDNGRVYYEVEFKDQGKNPAIRVAEDGTLIQNLQK